MVGSTVLDDAFVSGLPWELRCERGREAEDIIVPMFLGAGWSVLPFGATRPGSPVPPLLIPGGAVRPADCACWSPDGRRLFVLEIKSKTEMRALRGYGLDRRDDDDDPWKQLQQHDGKAGPVLLVIWDPVKAEALAATVTMLRANGGPKVTSNGAYWWWETSVFLPLEVFLKM